MKRIGVLTGGGDCPGLNVVIRAIVKAGILKYDLEIIGFLDGFKGLVLNKFIKLSLKRVSGILVKGGTILGTSNRDNPFEFRTESGEIQDKSDEVVKNYHKNKLDCLIVIGGDGTLNIAYKLIKKGISIIGVPKTIDNDLSSTDLTFGFLTAVETATNALDKLHTTAESHHRVMIVEVMGRDAGWIALYSGLAAGADVILIPEIPFTIDNIIKKINQRIKQKKFFSIIVIAEGAKIKNIGKVYADKTHHRLGGISSILSEKLESKIECEVRTTVLGHLQRGGIPISFDRIISTQMGGMAVELAMKKRFSKMVALNGLDVVYIDLKKAISKIKLINKNSDIIKVAKSIGISFG